MANPRRRGVRAQRRKQTGQKKTLSQVSVKWKENPAKALKLRSLFNFALLLRRFNRLCVRRPGAPEQARESGLRPRTRFRIEELLELVGVRGEAENGRAAKRAPGELGAGPRLGVEEFLKLVRFAFPFLGIGRGIALLTDIGPDLGVFGVHRQPFFHAAFGIRLDRFRRAFRLADAA